MTKVLSQKDSKHALLAVKKRPYKVTKTVFNYFLKQAEKMEGEKNFKIKTDGMEIRLPLATN